MQAAVITGPGVVEVTRVDDPRPNAGEVVVQVSATGICGTDLHILDGEFAPKLPVIPGHEFAGEVVALGAQVIGLSVGDAVAVDPSLYCGHCYYCRRAQGNMCENWRAVGVTDAGAAAEFVAVPAANCTILPSSVDPRNASLIEPLSCAVRGFDVLSRPVGDHYLIYGAGTMGLMNLELAKRAGAATVDVIDLNVDRLAVARQLGCTNASDRADEIVRERGWEVVIDCTGVIAAIEDGLTRVAKGGTFLQFGVSATAARATWSPYDLYRNEITITGSMAVLHSFERAAEMFGGGLIDPDVFITDRFPLQDYSLALDKFKSGTGRKIQVVP